MATASAVDLGPLIADIAKAAEPLRGLTESLEKLGGAMEQNAQVAPKLHQALNLPALAESMRGVRTAAADLGGHIKGLLGPLEALTKLGSLDGLKTMVTGFAAAGSEIGRTARMVGLPVEALQELRYHAEASGVPIKEMDKALGAFNQTLSRALDGGNPIAADALENAGIALRSADGEARNMQDVLADVSDRMMTLESATERAALMKVLFRTEDARLIDMMALGGEEMARSADRAHELGVVMGGDAVSSAEDMTRAQRDLFLAVSGLSNAIGSKLAPVLTPLINSLAEWIGANQDLVATKVEEVVTGLATALAAVDWVAVGQAVTRLASAMGGLVESTIGWEGVAVAVFALQNAGLITSVLGLAGAFFNLAGALGSTGVKSFELLRGAFPKIGERIRPILSTLGRVANGIGNALGTAARVSGSGIGRIAKVIGSGLSRVVGIVAGALRLLGATIMANPVAAAIVAVVAVIAGAAYLIYRNWDAVSAWLEGALGKLSGFASSIAERIGMGIDKIKTIFQPFADWIGSLFDDPLGTVRETWEGLLDFFGDIFGTIQKLFTDLWSHVGPVVDGIGGVVASAFDGVVSLFGGKDDRAEEETARSPVIAARPSGMMLQSAFGGDAPSGPWLSANGGASVGGMIDVHVTVTDHRAPRVEARTRGAIFREVDIGRSLIGQV